MRERIWMELTQAKHNEEFSGLYANRQRQILRYFNISILVFSTSGVMGWGVWDSLPLVACIIIAAISLLRLIQPQIVLSDKQFISLGTIQKFYTDYYDRLEKLWYDYEDGRLPEHQAAERFFEIKNTETGILELIGETIRTKPNGLVKKAKENSDAYFKEVFNSEIRPL
jgi:hypothetical protein